MQVFIPGTAADQAALPSELRPLADEGLVAWQDVETGPLDAGPGAVGSFARPRRKSAEAPFVRPRIGDPVDPSYTWHRLGDNVLIGWDPKSPPGPSDLERERMLPGAVLVLGDGSAWRIPYAAQLPYCLGVGDGAEVAPEVRDRYPAFVGKAYEALASIAARSDEPAKLDDADALELVVFALSVNYRLTPKLAELLGLFDSDNLLTALFAVTEAPEALAVAKGRDTLRGAQYRAWRAGLAPDYVPRVADLYLLANLSTAEVSV